MDGWAGIIARQEKHEAKRAGRQVLALHTHFPSAATRDTRHRSFFLCRVAIRYLLRAHQPSRFFFSLPSQCNRPIIQSVAAGPYWKTRWREGVVCVEMGKRRLGSSFRVEFR